MIPPCIVQYFNCVTKMDVMKKQDFARFYAEMNFVLKRSNSIVTPLVNTNWADSGRVLVLRDIFTVKRSLRQRYMS